MFRLCLSLTMVLGTLAFAAGPSDREILRNNEDLAYIKDWGKAQRMKGLAEALALNEEQASQLKAMRAEVDRIKASFTDRKQALVQELETAAKEIRQRLEAGGELEQGDKDRMRDIRSQYKRVRKEEKLNVALAVLDLGDLLSDAQKQTLRAQTLRQRGARDRSKRGQGFAGKDAQAFEAEANQRRGEARKAEGRGFRDGSRARKGSAARQKGSMARILLSDAFLKNLG